jgi:hypothetical protein
LTEEATLFEVVIVAGAPGPGTGFREDPCEGGGASGLGPAA